MQNSYPFSYGVNKFAYICIVEKRFEQYKGIHPGIVIERELKKRAIKQRPFALSLAEHPQTFNAVTKGRRSLNTALALKVENELQIAEGTLVLLQAYYDIRVAKECSNMHKPDLTKIRKALFWDTDINSIDWDRQFRAVIQRVHERGNDMEQEEMVRFYGKTRVAQALKISATQPMTLRSNPRKMPDATV